MSCSSVERDFDIRIVGQCQGSVRSISGTRSNSWINNDFAFPIEPLHSITNNSYMYKLVKSIKKVKIEQ